MMRRNCASLMRRKSRSPICAPITVTGRTIAAQMKKVRSRKPAMAAETTEKARTLMLNGWLMPRCASMFQPRNWAQITGIGPLRLAMPPSTPPPRPAMRVGQAAAGQ